MARLSLPSEYGIVRGSGGDTRHDKAPPAKAQLPLPLSRSASAPDYHCLVQILDDIGFFLG
jgi:hypothetical protein